ncbi:hypothetical protein GTP46_23585 [Duganella sp. FT135W]|uniref:DNA-binding protein n=1 Tax=Duganella flavida TaxID=2692175 RepID=A0A6L8KHE8_9BURK|nr:helix-turn-helix domain-containing protein [Duganella flavida]MYM25618.1 hypothetical protein [Duganella flavida]
MSQPTTLDLVLQISQGALLVPLKKTAAILGLETQTVRNRLCEKRFQLDPVKIGSRNFFRVSDIAQLIDASAMKESTPTRGRPRKSSKVAK